MTKFRCLGCRRYTDAPPYRRVGLGGVCSPECQQFVAYGSRRTQRRPKRPDEPADDVPERTRTQVLERDNHRCRYCGTRGGLHVHHINYRSQGVDHSEHNLIVLCHAHHDLVHANKRHWQPILRAYIWSLYVLGRRRWLRDLERAITCGGSLPR